MHVAHVNLAGGFRGGERQTELLVHALDERGIRQTLVCRRGGALEARMRAGGGRFEVFGVSWPYLLSTKSFGVPDIIHSHDGGAHTFVALASMRLRVPYVITRRIHPRPGSSLRTRTIYARAAALVAISHGVRDTLASWSGRDDVRVIPSASAGFEPDPVEVARIRRRFEGRTLAVCAAALDDSQKGQSALIEAARELEHTHPELVILLLGRGPSEAAFREAARDLDNVVFGGFVENLGDYLAAADLFVLPSNHEGLGSVLLDACSAGLPIVTTRIPGVVDVVREGVEGLLVPPRDPEALAAAMRRALDNRDLRDRLAGGALARAPAFDAGTMADGYLALYDELLARDR